MKFFLKLAVTVGLFALMAYYVDFQSVLREILSANLLYLLFAVVLQFMSTLIASYRWFFIMRILKFRAEFTFYFKSYFKGSFFNQLLPSNIGGDAVRVLDIRSMGYSVKEAFYGIFIDRVLGIAGLMLIALIASFTQPAPLEVSFYFMVKGMALTGIFGMLFLTLFHRNKFLANFFLLKRLAEMSRRFYTVFRETWSFIKQLCLSLLVHLFSILSIFVLALAVGVDQSLGTFFLIIPLVILFMAIPISLAGWGVREGAMTGLFLLVGADKEKILSVSLLYGIVVIITILPGLYYWAANRKNLF